MSLSRRGFFKGAAATGATLATGGGNAVAGGAVRAVTAGAGLAAALTAAERKARAAMALAKHGGFPIREIMAIAKESQSVRDVYKEAISSKTADILLGGGAPRIMQGDEGGKYISIRPQAMLLGRLRHLPQGVPIRDMINKDMMRDLASQIEGTHGETIKQLGGTVHYAEDDLDAFYNMIGAYVDENTTVGDLMQKGQDYFAKMTERFLQNPKDFAGDLPIIRNVAADLYGAVRGPDRKIKDDHPYKDILDRLSEHRERCQKIEYYLAQRDYRRRFKIHERDRKAHIERHEAQKLEKLAEQTQRKETPEARERVSLMLKRGARGEYIIDENAKVPNILKMDWLHFAQEIDPIGAKPKDIEIRRRTSGFL